MIDAITSFFQPLFMFFETIWNFLCSFFEDIVYVVTLLKNFLVSIPSYFDWLPSELIVMVVTIFGIVVLYKVLGREG